MVIRDGSTVHVRPIRADDGTAIRVFLEEISADSIAFRFFGTPNLNWVVAWSLDVDYADRFALIAESGTPSRIVAHAVYMRIDDERAEVAFLVADAWQGRGISTIMLAHLAAKNRVCGICFDPNSACAIRTAKKMTGSKSFLRELDDAVLRGTAESRARALWHTTDLMIAGRYSEDEIWTFGEVIGRLADEIEVAARAQLAKRLAKFDRAPVNIIHKLAFDDSIEVAGPILRESKRLESYALVANVCTKDQSHMLAITKRESIDESVTDVLVTRGNQEVVNSVANNDGARFSDFGFLHMIKRAEGDSILAEQLGLRKDIPRHVFQQLIAKASDDVRKRLERERPDDGGPDPDLGERRHGRIAIQIRPGIEKLFRRQARGDDAAPAWQSERKQHIRICAIP